MELKPCPFCGGEAMLIANPSIGIVYIQCQSCTAMGGSEYVVYQPSTEEPRPFYRVMCLNCGRKTSWHPCRHDAQNAWCEMVRRG